MHPVLLLTVVFDIQDQSEHQAEILAQALDIFPIADVWIDLSVVDHRKPVIGRVRKEGQQMQRRDKILEMVRQQELTQRLQKTIAPAAQMQLEQHEMSQCVQDKIHLLPETLRVVLILSDTMEMTHQEMAHILGITVSNVVAGNWIFCSDPHGLPVAVYGPRSGLVGVSRDALGAR